MGSGGVQVHAAFGGEHMWGIVCFFASAPNNGLGLPAHFGEVDDDGERAEDFVLFERVRANRQRFQCLKSEMVKQFTMKQRVYLSLG